MNKTLIDKNRVISQEKSSRRGISATVETYFEKIKTYDINSLTSNYTLLIKRNRKNARLSVHPNIPKNTTEIHAAVDEIM